MKINAEQLENRIASLNRLPTLPTVVQKISEIVDDRQSSASDVAAVLSADQVLCSKVLRMVNSPVYGFPGRITTIRHALVLLGFNVVKGLVLGSAVFGSLGTANVKGLWEHSLGTAILSRRLAKEIGMVEAEEVMVAGLLHDLGKVAMCHVVPQEYAALSERLKGSTTFIGDAEREEFGADHAEVGRWLARQWCFPARLGEPIACHHAPDTAQHAPEITAIVHIADILARGMGYGYPGDNGMPRICPQAHRILKLSPEQLDRILDDAENEYTAGAFVLDMGDNPC